MEEEKSYCVGAIHLLTYRSNLYSNDAWKNKSGKKNNNQKNKNIQQKLKKERRDDDANVMDTENATATTTFYRMNGNRIDTAVLLPPYKQNDACAK